MTNTSIASDISLEIDKLPSSLADEVRQRLEPFLVKLGGKEGVEVAAEAEMLSQPDVCRAFVRACATSEFVSRAIIRHPSIMVELFSSGDLEKKYSHTDFQNCFSKYIDSAETEQTLSTAIRQLRQREMFRIAWRDLVGWSDMHQTIAELSLFAEMCIQTVLDKCHGWQVEKLGAPLKADGGEQHLVVLGMGKLGGGELNFSSDIDLIFAYPQSGETQGGKRSVSHEEFFSQVGRQLINVLDQRTADGFVFRVDMRLRPFGDSGALVMSFDALENYYQSHGREWERYAMVKARVVAGDQQDGEQLMSMLHPFVYRRYLDFGAFDSIRDMKQRIEKEIRRKRLTGNVKLGEGGIREIEFSGQAFQLIRGGSEPRLQHRSILTVLSVLEELDYFPAFVVSELVAAYEFLRNTEHRLQEYADQQTHLLPTDETERVRLAFAMGYESWAAFIVVLQNHMKTVHEHFERIFEAPQTGEDKSREVTLSDIWLETAEADEALTVLAEEGFQNAELALKQIVAVHSSARYRSLPRQGRDRMDALMPLLIGAVSRCEEAEVVLKRVLDLVEGIARRTSYLALLVENPMVLSQLVKLCDISAWISNQLARQPILLDELFDPRSLYSPPGHAELIVDLEQRLSVVDEQDMERQMDVLRHFKNANMLRVAAADIADAMPLMVVSDHLTDIAEVIVGRVLDLAWNYMEQRHGRPVEKGVAVSSTRFAIIAYGKMGGIELGYGSDLDMVFLYDVDPNGETNGDRSIANAVFYSRLGQRIIHIFTAVTSAGILYEADMRLRPSGASGLLVTHADSFLDYQQNKAWTWEHQALVRARAIVGDETVMSRFNDIRRQVLSSKRDLLDTQEKVRTMRERMRKELDKSGKGQFDLKQGAGGIADIEFMVQYAVLAYATDDPNMTVYTDTIRILAEMVNKGLLETSEGGRLSQIYRDFRSRIHRLTLQEQPGLVSEEQVAEQVADVTACWHRLMIDEPKS